MCRRNKAQPVGLLRLREVWGAIFSVLMGYFQKHASVLYNSLLFQKLLKPAGIESGSPARQIVRSLVGFRVVLEGIRAIDMAHVAWVR